MSFKVGPMRFVVLNSYQAIVDAFQHPDLNDRPHSQMAKEVVGLANNGKMMKQIRFQEAFWKLEYNFIIPCYHCSYSDKNHTVP